MVPLSVVIITKNEAHIIERCVRSILALTDDIVVVDSGSTDGTMEIVKSLGCRLIETDWKGYGPTKNLGNDAARYDWIFTLDADEICDHELIENIQKITFDNPKLLYRIRFKNYLGQKIIKYGEWGKEYYTPIFNKTQISWNDAKIHEELVIPETHQLVTVKGAVHHYTMKNLVEFSNKMNNYAVYLAEHLYKRGKKSTWLKRNLSHRFSFVLNYYLKLGFLDGIEGYWIARMTSQYTFLKYARLYELHQVGNTEPSPHTL